MISQGQILITLVNFLWIWINFEDISYLANYFVEDIVGEGDFVGVGEEFVI